MREARASERLSGLVRKASELTEEVAGLGADRMLPVLPELRDLLPGRGLRRGSTIAVGPGPQQVAGRTSLLLALLAATSKAGSWCAVVGMPTLGLAAAADAGVSLERLALVPHPGPEWTAVVSVLLDGFDVVVLSVPGQIPAGVRGQLAARARQRGSVLIPLSTWEGADVTLSPASSRWLGLGQGSGRLRHRELTVVSSGRGAAARPRKAVLWPHGRPDAVEPEPTRALSLVRGG